MLIFFFLPSLRIPLGLNTVYKVEVRGKQNQKLHMTSPFSTSYLFEDKHDTTCINNNISHRYINLPHRLSTAFKFYKTHVKSVWNSTTLRMNFIFTREL